MIYHVVDAQLNYLELKCDNDVFRKFPREFIRKENHYLHSEIPIRYYFKKEDAEKFIQESVG